jgi:HAD superfamily hydrolase (TIGR01509 family)
LISHVIFDVGWVFVALDYRELLELAPSRAAATSAEGAYIERLAAEIGLAEHESGRLDGRQLLANIVRLTGDRATADEARAAWNGMFKLQPRMVDLAARLSERYRVHLLSNVGDLHWAYLTATYGLHRIGHGALTSFEAGVMKPHPEIYKEAERRFGLVPPTTVFIDDRLENVEAARARGWHGIVHTDHDSTVEALRRLGVT